MSEKKELSMDELGEVSGGRSAPPFYIFSCRNPKCDGEKGYIIPPGEHVKCDKCGSDMRIEKVR